MIYTVECYKNTGLNSVNIPESLDWLRATYTAVTFPSIDVLQSEGLQTVNIKATWEQARDIDYVVIGDECYAAMAVPRMTSPDVVTLELVEDVLTSCGGAGSLTYLDGITERHTVDDDTMFRYVQDDEYMTPQEALKVVTTEMLFDNGDVVATPVESTIDLVKLGDQFDDDGNFNGKGITFSESEGTLENKVTTPYTEGVTARTMYVLGDATSGPLSPNTRLYEANNDNYPKINKALAVVRSLGVESALISQVAFPEAYITPQIGEDGQYSFNRGKDTEVDSTLPFKYTTDVNVHNNRIYYGQYNKYGLLTADGSSGEFLPEQIAETSSDEQPTIRSVSDPRPDGKPYFRYKYYCGTVFYMSCLTGMQWANVPLTYTSKSGSYMDVVNFKNSAQQASNSYQASYRDNYTSAFSITGIIGEIKNGIADVLQAATNITNFIQTLVGSSVTGPSTPNKYFGDFGNQRQTLDKYNLQRQNELNNFSFGQAVVAPQVLFPFNANLIRDFFGNGVIAYRYRYTDTDIKRIDKLLTMYGYKDTVQLTGSLFHCRQYFDYVRASGVSVGGTIPMWKRELIAGQLNTGVRVWHVKPDVSYYDNNPIRSTT